MTAPQRHRGAACMLRVAHTAASRFGTPPTPHVSLAFSSTAHSPPHARTRPTPPPHLNLPVTHPSQIHPTPPHPSFRPTPCHAASHHTRPYQAEWHRAASDRTAPHRPPNPTTTSPHPLPFSTLLDEHVQNNGGNVTDTFTIVQPQHGPFTAPGKKSS